MSAHRERPARAPVSRAVRIAPARNIRRHGSPLGSRTIEGEGGSRLPQAPGHASEADRPSDAAAPGGTVPQKDHRAILAESERGGLQITADDLLPAAADSTETAA